jgi:peptidyl-prolyl cis-trans isomerase C
MRGFRTALVLLGALAFLACNKDKPAEPAPQEGTQPAAQGTTPAPAATPAATPAPEGAEKTAPVAAAPAEEPIPDVVARVNGKDIKADEYREEIQKITSRGAKIPPERMARIKDNILKRIIEKELIDQEIAKQGITVSDEEIQAAFDEYKKRFRTDEQFENYLKHGKVTIEEIKERMRNKRALEKLIEKTGDLTVTDAEAKEFYDKNERFYVEKEGVRASHILVKVDENAPPEKVEAAKKKIEEIQAELKKGADFDEVATKYSEGPSAPKGGDLGFFGRGQMVKPFEDVAFAMKVGEVSQPVRTRFGFHIIKVLEKRTERKKPFEEVKDQIVESLRNKKFFKERRTLIKRLNDEAKIEKFI